MSNSDTQETVKQKIEKLIIGIDSPAFIKKEFKEFGTDAQITKAIKELIDEKKLIRVGVGIYTKGRASKYTDKAVASFSVTDIAISALKKMGVDAEYSDDHKDLFSGRSTQVPVRAVVNVKNSKIKRKISLGRNEVTYERN